MAPPISDSIMALGGDKSSKEIEDWSNEVEEATLKKDARFHAHEDAQIYNV